MIRSLKFQQDIAILKRDSLQNKIRRKTMSRPRDSMLNALSHVPSWTWYIQQKLETYTSSRRWWKSLRRQSFRWKRLFWMLRMRILFDDSSVIDSQTRLSGPLVRRGYSDGQNSKRKDYKNISCRIRRRSAHISDVLFNLYTGYILALIKNYFWSKVIVFAVLSEK